jgi:hypothetical protein
MGDGQRRTSGDVLSFARQFIVVLKDLRLWAVLLPFLVLSGLAVSFLPARPATVLTLMIGLLASYLIGQIEKLPAIEDFSSLTSLYERTLFSALVGILPIPGSEVLPRLWMMPWYWFHTRNATLACSFLIGAVAWDWLGFFVCRAVIAIQTGKRATFAATIGVAI